jgi:hypothetical protein
MSWGNVVRIDFGMAVDAILGLDGSRLLWKWLAGASRQGDKSMMLRAATRICLLGYCAVGAECGFRQRYCLGKHTALQHEARTDQSKRAVFHETYPAHQDSGVPLFLFISLRDTLRLSRVRQMIVNLLLEMTHYLLLKEFKQLWCLAVLRVDALSVSKS